MFYKTFHFNGTSVLLDLITYVLKLIGIYNFWPSLTHNRPKTAAESLFYSTIFKTSLQPILVVNLIRKFWSYIFQSQQTSDIDDIIISCIKYHKPFPTRASFVYSCHVNELTDAVVYHAIVYDAVRYRRSPCYTSI